MRDRRDFPNDARSPNGAPTFPRVCVVDSADLGSAYPRVAECAFDVMAVVPSIDLVDVHLVAEYDAVIVGCSPAELADLSFQGQALRITRTLPAIAVMPTGADAAAAARLGFRGLLAREVSPAAVERTVRAVGAGELAFPRSSLDRLFKSSSARPRSVDVGAGGAGLTPRQQQVVHLIALGATDREIAKRLRISQSTAHKHVQNALRRSNTSTRSQLVALVRQSPLA